MGMCMYRSFQIKNKMQNIALVTDSNRIESYINKIKKINVTI